MPKLSVYLAKKDYRVLFFLGKKKKKVEEIEKKHYSNS